MATSGSTDVNLTRNQIITDALMAIGVLGAEDTLAASDQTYANRVLDQMIKQWQATGIGLWAKTEATLFLTDGTAKYQLGGSGAAKASNTVVETTTTAAAALGASTIAVTTATGMAVSDNIGIVLDNNTIQWTTISAIASLTITLAATLTSAAASGNRVYTYTTAVGRPLDITQVRLRNDSDSDRVLTPLAREDYFAIYNKTTEGVPSVCYYDSQLNSAFLYVWPVPDSVDMRIKYTYTRTLDDMDSATDNPDFPQEWLLAIVFNLAVLLAPAYGKEPKVQQGLGQMASYALQTARSFDIDAGSVFFRPDTGDDR